MGGFFFMTVKRWDKLGAVKFDAQVTGEGWIQAVCPVTRTGVFSYQMPDGTVLRELRHPDDVFSSASLKTLEMIPLQVRHVAMLTPDNCKELQAGHVGQDIKVGAPYVWAPVRITTQEGIDAAKSGVDQLSCGYFCNVVAEKGVYNGEEYDARQKDIVYNHLALCEQARLGPELRFAMDAQDAIQAERDSRLDSDPKKENPMLVKVTLPTGHAYDAAPEVGTEYRRLTEELATTKQAMATADSAAKAAAAEAKRLSDAEIEKLKGERDAIQGKLDTALADLKKVPAQIKDSVRARINLEAAAAKVLDEADVAKLDGMDDDQIRKAVIMAKQPDAKLDGKSAEYILARFDSLIENLDEEDGDTAMAETRAAVAPRQDSQPAKDSADGARKAYIDRLTKKDKKDGK